MRPNNLGQHFLKSHAIINTIISTANVGEKSKVLEVGPGKGILTLALLQNGAKVVAIEKDSKLYKYLQEKFTKYLLSKQLILANEDILTFDIKKYLNTSEEYKIVANIPYYITGSFLKKFLTHEYKPSSITILVQKEVAERITKRNNKQSMLSLSVWTYGKPKIIAKVKKQLFSPPPQVDSSILHISEISNNFFVQNNIAEAQFFKLIRIAFSQKRKLLSNSLKHLLLMNKNADALKKAGIAQNARPEDVPISSWAILTKLLS
jgi:16S rRNA (adenine1518-N6/adenine1519-N6)-dimethyltransferase